MVGGRRTCCGFLCSLFSVMMVSAIAFAQDQPVPKVDIFTGYQWLNPGGSVPNPFGTPSAPISQQLPSIGNGFVGDATYNFNRIIGLSVDYGKDWGSRTNEGLLSLGPRFMW